MRSGARDAAVRIGFAVLVTAVRLAGVVVLARTLGGLGEAGAALAFNAVLSLYALALVALLGWWRVVGFGAPRARAGGWWPLLPAVALAASPLVRGVRLDAGFLLAEAAICLLIGFNEELLSRGVVLRALRSLGEGWAVGLSSALFGLQHVGWLLNGQPWDVAVGVMVGAALGGVGFAAIRLRLASLWPAVGLHALWDYAGLVAGWWPWWASRAIDLAFCLYGIWWLRRGRGEEGASARIPSPRAAGDPAQAGDEPPVPRRGGRAACR